MGYAEEYSLFQVEEGPLLDHQNYFFSAKTDLKNYLKMEGNYKAEFVDSFILGKISLTGSS